MPVACHDCRYYLVTWDVQFPHGCRAHILKSKKSPSLQVYEASGLECQLYAPKKPRAAVSGEPQSRDVS